MNNWSVLALLSAVVSGVADLYLLGKEIFRSTSSRNQEVSDTPPVSPIEQQTERYQEILGQRHKDLRKNILGLSPKEMSNFYGFETTLYLEKYEDGVDEFPNESI